MEHFATIYCCKIRDVCGKMPAFQIHGTGFPHECTREHPIVCCENAIRLVDDCAGVCSEHEIKCSIIVNVAFDDSATCVRVGLPHARHFICKHQCPPIDNLAAGNRVFIKSDHYVLALRNGKRTS